MEPSNATTTAGAPSPPTLPLFHMSFYRELGIGVPPRSNNTRITCARLLVASIVAIAIKILTAEYLYFRANRGDFGWSSVDVIPRKKSASLNTTTAFDNDHSEVNPSAPAASSSSSLGGVTFKGANNFLPLLRQAHKRKIANPLPHCKHSNNNTSKNLSESNHDKIRIFNRAIEVDWIGRNISSVEPTWSANGTSSCQFAALAFPPTDDTLSRAIQQKTYVSSFYTASQCGLGNTNGAFQWDPDMVRNLYMLCNTYLIPFRV